MASETGHKNNRKTAIAARTGFFEWLTNCNTGEYSGRVIVACLDNTSKYITRKRICPVEIWEFININSFNRLYNRLMKSILFRIAGCKRHKIFIVAGRLYLEFLREKQAVSTEPVLDELSDERVSQTTVSQDTIAPESGIDSVRVTDNQELGNICDSNANEELSNALEPAMQVRSGLYPMPSLSSSSLELLEPVLTQAFITQPLLGNVLLNSLQKEKIYNLAENTLFSALSRKSQKEYGLEDFDCDILVLETVLLLRNWSDSDDANDSGANESFWEYICNQYALPYDPSNFGNSHTYKIFRLAIEKSLDCHKRLFLTTGQKYYTTMLTHALAPKSKFFALFEQILAFYARTLHYQYIRADPAFSAFALAMKNRFESGHSRSDDSVYIKSVQSSSAIKALFLNCPEYMSDFVECTVYAIDTLIATGNLQEISYHDCLLLDWYINRVKGKRIIERRERSKARNERVITEFSKIRVVYRYASGQVSLIVPSIRLGTESEEQPWITIHRYPGDETPYSERLSYYGDYFCITSSRAEISLDVLLQEEAVRIEPQVIISYGGKAIYDSGTKLYRDAISFSEDGSEVSKRPDKEYINIFIAESADISGEETSADYSAAPCGAGFLYRVLVDENTYININENNLFPVERVVRGLTLNLSVAPVNHCKFIRNHQDYVIFVKQTTISVESESQFYEKRYRLMIDETTYPLAEYLDTASNNCIIMLPDSYGVHELQIIENETNKQVYTLRYVVIECFSVHFNAFYYSVNFGENGSVEITDNETEICCPYELLPEQDTMLVPYRDGDLALDIPLLFCRFNGESMPFEMKRTLWYNDIPMSALLEVDAPRGYSSTVVIGGRTFSSAKVEIGNEIRARHDLDIEAVGLIIRKDGEATVNIQLFDIAFEPSFKSEPLYAEGSSLLWTIEDNFIGDAESEFEFRVYNDDFKIEQHRVGCKDIIIPLEYRLEDGVYEYTVKIKSPGFFSQFEELRKGRIYIGDPAQFIFKGRAIIATEAIIDNERVKLNPASGIITNLTFIGVQPLNGEAQPYPCYEGKLQYKYDGRLLQYATKDLIHNGIRREKVNPVKLWVINEYTISLRDPYDGGLHINRKWSSITDRTPPKRSGTEDYFIPDYYAYKVIEQSEVKNV